jgi:hypothetical protein
LNILPVPCAYIMETIYYIKLNNKELKQNMAIHDYKTRHRLHFQTQLCRNYILKRVQIIWVQNYIINFQTI